MRVCVAMLVLLGAMLVAGCSNLGIGDLPIEIKSVKAIPAEGLNYTKGDHPLIPGLAASVIIDSGKLDLKGIKLEGEVEGVLLLNATELAR